MREAFGVVIAILANVLYAIASILAFISVLQYYLSTGHSTISSVVISLLLSAIPFVSSFIAAYYGSIVWSISYWQMLLILFSPYLVGLLAVLFLSKVKSCFLHLSMSMPNNMATRNISKAIPTGTSSAKRLNPSV